MLSNCQNPERDRIYRTAKQLQECLHEFFKPYPVFQPSRFPATALATAIEHPKVAKDILLDMSIVTVWIFTIDAVIDEKLLPESILRRKLELYEEIVSGRREVAEPDDPYGAVLLYVAERIRSKPLYRKLRYLWEEAYRSMIRGMLCETYDQPANVTLEEYLEQGCYSIGAPLYVISGWILNSHVNSDEFMPIDDMITLLRHSARCIRLANDLRTYEKERLEHKLNAIFLIEKEWIDQGKDQETSLELSIQYIKSLLNFGMDQFMAMCDDEHAWKISLRRLTRFSIDFYASHDFHTVSSEQIHTL